jgi:hypothetical protein
MTRCRELEALLGGDAAGLAGHLSGCPVCRDGLRGLAAEEGSAGVYAAVRQAALMVALLLQLPPDPAPPELALHAPPAPPVSPAPPEPPVEKSKPAREQPFATVARADANGILLRLRSGEPNVVIYWQIDGNGGSE